MAYARDSRSRALKTALTGQTYLQRFDVSHGSNANTEDKAQPFAAHGQKGDHLGCVTAFLKFTIGRTLPS